MDEIETIAEQVESKPEIKSNPEGLSETEVVVKAVNEAIETHGAIQDYGEKVERELEKAGSDPGIVEPELKELADLRQELNEIASEGAETMKPDENIEKFERDFFSEPWETMTGVAASEISSLETADEKTKYLWDGIKPVLDVYIEQNKIPVTNAGADKAHFERVVSHMYELNQKTLGCWKDCWPETALEVHRTNCALGSLVAAEVFIKSGIPEDEIEYGFPGPMSHANLFVGGYYIDQANGVVIPTKGERVVDGIKCYELDVASEDEETLYKIPFRLVPAAPLHKGVASLIWNLDPMATDTKRKEESQELSSRFGVSRENAHMFSNYARGYLMAPEWNPKRMRTQPEWQKERLESSERINAV